MPRGVYDRSKMKKKTEGSPASAKKTWSRRAKTTETAHTSSPTVHGDIGTLASLREHLTVLSNSRTQVAGNNGLIQKIDAQISRTVEEIGSTFDEAYPKERREEVATASRNAGAAPAQAPVPFNPPGFSAPQAQQ